ncbi:MAG: hypothetical protein GX577_02645 [Leptolinea sp.]|nr:hypothetical protein [Leptolinea sp.]
MKKLIPVFLLFSLLGGCANLPFQIPGVAVPTLAQVATLASDVVEVVATNTPVPQEPTATEVPSLPVQPKIQPEQTVTLFLDGLKSGASYNLTSNLFSADYASQIKDDAGLAGIFGTTEDLGEFKVGYPTISSDSMSSTLESTLYIPEPINVQFSLVLENGEWKINDIIVLSPIGEYPSNPEEVVLAFLAAYQEAPDRMSHFLVSSRRAQQPPGGATSMLQINGDLGGMVVQSAAVSPEPPTASIEVTILAGGKEYQRRFLLTIENSVWGIDAIEDLSGQDTVEE